MSSPDGKGKKLLLTVDPVGVDPLPGERTSPTAAGAKRRFARSYIELTKARPQNAHNPEDFTVRGSIWARNGKRQADEPNRYISYWTKWEYMKPYPPYRAGSIRSGMIQMLDKGHQGITLSTEEMDKLRAWIDLNIPYCGEYDDDNIWNQRDQKLFRQRMDERLRNEKIEDRNIREFIRDGQP